MVTPLEGCLIETRLYILAVFSIIFYTCVLHGQLLLIYVCVAKPLLPDKSRS